MNNNIKSFLSFEHIEKMLLEQIRTDYAKGASEPWTHEYREGYVDGLDQALSCLYEIASTGIFPIFSIDRNDLNLAGFDGNSINDEVIESIATKIGATYRNEDFSSDIAFYAKKYGIPKIRF